MVVNEINERKSSEKLKLKADSQEERLQKWKEHFKNLFGNPPEITEEIIIDGQLDIQLGSFMENEIDTVLKTKAEKLQNQIL